MLIISNYIKIFYLFLKAIFVNLIKKLGKKMIPFSDDELIEPVKQSLSKQLHILHKDGGDLEFLGIKSGIVYVQLTGACSSCIASNTTLKHSLEKQLKLDIHPELSIVNLRGGINEFKKL